MFLQLEICYFLSTKRSIAVLLLLPSLPLSLQRTATWGCSSEVVLSPCTSLISRGRATASTTRWRYLTTSLNCSGCILQTERKTEKLFDGSEVSGWIRYDLTWGLQTEVCPSPPFTVLCLPGGKDMRQRYCMSQKWYLITHNTEKLYIQRYLSLSLSLLCTQHSVRLWQLLE